jgi:nuclear pore complex protein Nup93
MAYDRAVVELNAARLRGASFPIVHAFIQVTLSLNPEVRVVQSCSGIFFSCSLL